MTILDDLRKLSSAVEFFDVLGVDYDPAVIRVARLHILRRMGEYLRSADLKDASDEQAKEACKAHLTKAYEDFVASSPIEQRVFKVLTDAVKPMEEPKIRFVSLSVLTTTTADNS